MGAACISPAKPVGEQVRALVAQFQQRLREAEVEFPRAELDALRDCGALSAALPLGLGGEGWGLDPGTHGNLLSLLHDVGSANLALGRIFEGHVNALQLISQHGTDRQISKTASAIMRHSAVFGVWNTGPVRQPLLRDCGPDCYELNGGKTFASGVADITHAVVTADLNGGWQMIILPLAEARLKIDKASWAPFGMEASNSFTVDFTGTRIPKHSLLGEPGAYYGEPMFTGGAFRFSSVQLGGASALLSFLSSFLRETRRHEDPHQLARLGRVAVAVQSGQQWIQQAASWLDQEHADLLPLRAHMMRTAAEEICMNVMNLVEVSIGARGLLAGQPFSRTIRDLRMYLRQAGSDNAVTSIGRAFADAG